MDNATATDPTDQNDEETILDTILQMENDVAENMAADVDTLKEYASRLRRSYERLFRRARSVYLKIDHLVDVHHCEISEPSEEFLEEFRKQYSVPDGKELTPSELEDAKYEMEDCGDCRERMCVVKDINDIFEKELPEP
jgi:hypothetical protein